MLQPRSNVAMPELRAQFAFWDNIFAFWDKLILALEVLFHFSGISLFLFNLCYL